jgi:hypothetical protein
MFPKDYVMLRKGNFINNGQTLNLGLKENFTVYHEFSAGIAKKFYNGLTLGMRLKYLKGLVNLQTKKSAIDWTVSNEDTAVWAWKFTTDFEINSSVPMSWQLTHDKNGFIDGAEITEFNSESDSETQKYFENNAKSFLFTPNTGWGVDLGFDYQINRLFTVSGSIIDLGYIKWKDNPKTAQQAGTFMFNGIDMAKYYGSYNSVVNAGTTTWADSLVNDMTDSLRQYIDPKISTNAYKTSLRTKFYLGGNFAPTNWFDIGFLYKGYYLDKDLHTAITLSANLNFLKACALSVSWSRWNKLNNNIGIGFAYRIGHFQMYVLSDNIAIPFWAVNESNTSDRWIRNTNRATLHLGFNWLFCKEKVDIGLLD